MGAEAVGAIRLLGRLSAVHDFRGWSESLHPGRPYPACGYTFCLTPGAKVGRIASARRCSPDEWTACGKISRRLFPQNFHDFR